MQGIEEDAEDDAAAEQHDEDHSEDADAVVDAQGIVGKEVPEDVAAVERRYGDEVEDEEDEVEEDDVVEEERDREEWREAFGRDTGEVLGEQHCGDRQRCLRRRWRASG